MTNQYIKNSFGLDASVSEIIKFDETHTGKITRPWFILGHGSNCLIDSHLDGQCLMSKFQNIEIISNTSNNIICKVGADIKWHNFVILCLKNGWHGLENLALIPGSVGATPIQNIGAYGVEVSNRIIKVGTIDLINNKKHEIINDECKFSYRNSIFQKELKTHLITHVYFKLDKIFTDITNYNGLVKTKCARQRINQIIRTRRAKLPNPKFKGNAGSFFKNPTVDKAIADKLPEMAKYHTKDDKYKISAAALIDRCNLKGFSIGEAAVSTKHALIIVNNGKASYQDVKRLSQVIQEKVLERFGIFLATEVQFIETSSLQQPLAQMA